MTTTTEEIKELSQLVRTVEANLKIRVPSTEDMQFRASLLAKVRAELPTMPHNFIVRLYESACDVEHPDDSISALRTALQRSLGTTYALRQFRPANQTK